jgi:hypothetical protein
MGRCGEGGKAEQRELFKRGNLVAMRYQHKRRQHRRAGENVRQ